MLILLYVMLAIILICDIHIINHIADKLASNSYDKQDKIDTAIKSRGIVTTQAVMVGISAVLVACLPVYSKWIRKINTSVEVAENAEMETIDISGEPYSDKTKYDLTASPTIGVTAASGLVKTYQVYTLSYPVFETFSIDGVAGTTTYSAYSYDKTFVSVTLPSGTDLTRLKPVFSSADALSVSIDGQPQTSGMSEVDFSQTVTYTLTNQLADHPECRCESQVVVEVTVK